MTRSFNKNKFGGFTWMIKLNSEFHIIIDEASENTFMVELKEAYYIRYRTCLTYVSNKSMLETIEDAFKKVSDYFIEKKKIYWEELREKKFQAREDYRKIIEHFNS